MNDDADRYGVTARRLVSARLAAVALADFPGEVPGDLDGSYACQEEAISLWPDRIAGWKIGLINPPDDVRLGSDRLAGPIFSRSVIRAHAAKPTPFPVFDGGFAAAEAEFVFEIGIDAPPGKRDWTRAEATALVAQVYVGIETAGSPMATINELGPLVVASDFGNNAGVILGPAFEGWRERPQSQWSCETLIDGRPVGRGAASDLPGGPFEAMRFIAKHCADRGRPLTAGTLISTGAITGVHDIVEGQTATIRFSGVADLACLAVAARPLKRD
jgi:2-keto-4-pentenoate hydratase